MDRLNGEIMQILQTREVQERLIGQNLEAFPPMTPAHALYEAIVESLSACGIPADDILIVVHEPPMHNWAVKGGVPANEVDLGFEIGI